MNEPRRWLDPESDASGDLRALLAAGPSATPPLPPDARESGARFVAGLAPLPLAPRPWWAKGALAAGSVGTTSVALVVVALMRTSPAPPQTPRAPRAPTHAVAPTAPVVTAPVVTAPVVTAPVVTAPVVTAPVETAPVVTAPVVTAPTPSHREAPTAHAPSVTEARDEQRLEEARRLLDRDPGAALSIARSLTGHGRHSHFAEEAEYLSVRALARLDRDAEARAEGERFLMRHPSGIYSAAVRRQMENLQ